MRSDQWAKPSNRRRDAGAVAARFVILRALAIGFLYVAAIHSGIERLAAGPPTADTSETTGEQTVDAADIQLMSYNIRYANPNDGEDVWPRRAAAVIDVVSQPDIVGLQEVTALQWDALRQATPQQAWYGVGREDGERGGELTPIGFRRDRFEKVDQGTFWLSETPDEVGSKGWDAALPRIASWVVLRDRVSHQTLLVLNTHFDHRGEEARIESGKLIQQKVSEMAGDHHVIVMGDLNASPQSKPLQRLQANEGGATTPLHDSRLVSESEPVGPEGTWNGFAEINNDRRIDHVLVGDSVSVNRYETLDPRTPQGRFASDHLPVAITVRLSANESESR